MTTRSFIKKHFALLVLALLFNAASSFLRTYGSSFLEKITSAIERNTSDAVWKLAFGGALVMVLSYFLRWSASVLCQFLSEKFSLSIRVRLFEHLTKIHFCDFESLKIGDVQSIYRNDVDLVGQTVYALLSRVINSIFLLTFSVAYLASINVTITLIISIIILLTTVISRNMLKKYRNQQYNLRKSLGSLSDKVNISYSGIDTIKAFGAYKYASHIFIGERKKYNKHAMNAEITDAKRQGLYSVVNYVLLFGTMTSLGYLTIRQQVSLGQVVLYLYLVKQIMVPVDLVFRWLSAYAASSSAWARIKQILEISIGQNEQKCAIENVEHVEVTHINYTHKNDIVPLLSNVNIRLEKGKIIGLSGSSGSGKTTLMKILMGLYECETATFYVNNIQVNTLSNLISYASVENDLLPMTLYENLRLGNEDVTKSDCLALLDRLGFSSWVASLPNNLDTNLHGNDLSGGQRQIVANARALLSNAPIIMLDEPFSALDEEKELLLRCELIEQSKHRIVFFSSHRQSTLAFCDSCIML